jgi:hypothetical protein
MIKFRKFLEISFWYQKHDFRREKEPLINTFGVTAITEPGSTRDYINNSK